MDVYRDADAAFGAASAEEGGLLPYEGRSFLSPLGTALAGLDAETDGWLSPNNPVLVRGQAKILPLAWRGDPLNGHGSGVETREIDALASQMQSSGMYSAGPWRIPDLTQGRDDSIGSYAAALREAGASQVSYWTYDKTLGFALVRAGVEDEGTMSLAFHVVPASWVSESRTGPAVHGIDVRWSWADVVALHAARNDDSD